MNDPEISFDRQGDGEPMLLVHGIGGERCVWEPVLAELSEAYEVVNVDLPGFGSSPPLRSPTAPTPRALAGTLAKLLDFLGIERAHLAGNSLGGWIALELAALKRALSVTALCPAGLWPSPTLGPGEAVRATAQRAARRLRPVVPAAMALAPVRRAALASFMAHPERVPYSTAVRMVRSYGRATAYEATATAMRQNVFSASGGIDVPVTLAFGEHDRLIAPARTRIRGARTVIMRGCGHIPMWDDPRLVSSLIARTAGSGQTADTVYP